MSAYDPTQSQKFTHNSKLSAHEPTWGSVNKGKLPQIAFARKGEADKKSTWGFPHHWVQNGKDPDNDGIFEEGTLWLHRGGLNAAWSAAMGGRSGQKAEPAVIAHLRKHFSDLGIKKADLQALCDDMDLGVSIDEIDAELLAANLVTEEDLRARTVADRIQTFMQDLKGKK